MEKSILPSVLQGRLIMPPSKSYAHRAIVCAALSEGISIIKNVDLCDDVIATMNGIIALGAKVEIRGNELIIEGTSGVKSNVLIDCDQSATTLRFLTPVASIICSGNVTFLGHGKLTTKITHVYDKIFKSQNIEFEDSFSPSFKREFNGRLQAGKYNVPGDISSQFASGLMFALSLLSDDSEIIMSSELESKGYIDMTISILDKFGIYIENYKYEKFIIKGGQKYKAQEYEVEGDYTQAALFEVANYIGNNIKIEGLQSNSCQGDKIITKYIEELQNGNGKDLSFDGKECIDVVPIFAVACALYPGKTEIKDISRLRVKEIDRLEATYLELKKLGANIKIENDSFVIEGVDHFIGTTVDSHKDHRLAMMLAIAATRCDSKLTIKNSESVFKSYPMFYEDYMALGGKIE